MTEAQSRKAPRPTRAYQQQLARAARLYGRVLGRGLPTPDSAEAFAALEKRMADYEDDVSSFFINCWHVRDWLKYDPTVDAAARERALRAAEANRWMNACADLANGRKHFKLNRTRAGAEVESVRMSWTSGAPVWTMELYVQVGDDEEPVSAALVGWEALRAWTQILEAEGLPLPPEYPDLTSAPTASGPLCR